MVRGGWKEIVARRSSPKSYYNRSVVPLVGVSRPVAVVSPPQRAPRVGARRPMSRVHDLVRARTSALVSPSEFRAIVTRSRYSALTLQPADFPRVDGAGAACFDLDRVERRYLLCGTLDGGACVYDTESSARDGARRTHGLVCAVPGGGARPPTGAVAPPPPSESTFVGVHVAHTYATSCAKWLPSDTGAFFTAGFDGCAKFWDANTLCHVSELTLESKCRALASSEIASTHALVAIGTDDAVVRLWDPGASVVAHTLSGHRGSVRAMDWATSNEFQIATGGAEGDVRVWDIRRAGAFMILDRHNTQMSAHVEGIKDAMYAGAVGVVASAGAKPASRKMADSIPEHLKTDAARRCSTSSYVQRERAKGGLKRARDGGWGGWGVGFRPKNGERRDEVSTSMSARVQARDGYSSVAARAHDDQVTGLKVTPCGLFLISTGADARVRRWDLTTGLNTYAPYEECGPIPTADACQMAISGDGEHLFVPCITGETKVFRTHTGTFEFALKGHLDEAFACAHKDGGAATLFTLGKDRNILSWAPAGDSESHDFRDRITNGDAWSDDDADDGVPGVGADPHSRFGPVRGLGYRSFTRSRALR